MRPAVRITKGNPDHHLWNNNGTWWIHYTVHPNPIQKQRIRASLRTDDRGEARKQRDMLFTRLVREAA